MPTVMERHKTAMDSPHSPKHVQSARLRRNRIAIPLALLITVTTVATAGYVLIESPDYSFLDALYMTVITITTLGIREVGELSAGGQIWTMLVVLSGVVSGGVVLSLLGQVVVEGQIRRLLGRRQLETKIKNLSGHIILCGYGRMGSLVAQELRGSGRKLVIVDIAPTSTAAAESEDLLYVLGDAQEEVVLEAAGIDKAHELISTLPSDAGNVMVTLTARSMQPDLRIITRARSAAAQNKLTKAGATRVVCPHVIGATHMANVIMRPAVVDFVDFAGKGVDIEMDQIELSATSELIGKTLQELELPRRVGVHLAAIQRTDGEMVYNPTSELMVEQGDTLIVIGRKGAVEELQQFRL